MARARMGPRDRWQALRRLSAFWLGRSAERPYFTRNSLLMKFSGSRGVLQRAT